ncbi:MAG: hypothetical protein ABI668_02795 [Sphingorhabdus sp.]
MKITKKFAAVLVTSSFGLGAVANMAVADQPRMQSALSHLEQARADLATADKDKGGHRQAALRQVNNAIAHVRAGMRFDRQN